MPANASALVSKPKSTGFIEDVQILRALAIVSVLTVHLSISSAVIGHLPFKITNPFYSGVELFFIISGFVVARSLIRTGFDPVSFGIRRIMRLYPALIVFLVMVVATNELYKHAAPTPWALTYFTISHDDLIRQAVGVLSGTFILDQHKTGYVFGAMWTLSVEFQFYALTLLLILLLKALRTEGHIIPTIFFWAAAVIVALSLHARLRVLFGVPLQFESYLINYKFDFLAMGAMLACAPEEKLNVWARRFGQWAPVAIYGMTVLVLAFCRSPLAIASRHDELEGFGMIGAGLAFTILVALASSGKNYVLIKEPMRALLLLIGDRSYTLYLLHFPCMAVAWWIIYLISPSWTSNAFIYPAAQIAVTLALLIPLTELIFRFVEKPAIAWGSHCIRKMREGSP